MRVNLNVWEKIQKKYITFPIPIKRELDSGKTITYKIKFIDSFRFISSSLSSLVDNLSEGLHSDKCTDCKSCINCMMLKDDQQSCTQSLDALRVKLADVFENFRNKSIEIYGLDPAHFLSAPVLA